MTVVPQRSIAPVHVVTDDRILARPDFVETAKGILELGGPSLAFHVRGPGTAGRRIEEICRALLPAARDAEAMLQVNDRVDVALALNAELAEEALPGNGGEPRPGDRGVGAHLGQRSLDPAAARELLGPRPWIGYSAHEPTEVDVPSGSDFGADYLFVGTIFPSASHPEREAAGVDLLRRFVEERPDPPLRIAIGGVTTGRVAEVREAGADGVAVIGAVWSDDDPPRAAALLIEAWHG